VDKASGALARTRSRAEFLATSKETAPTIGARGTDGNAKAVELAFTLNSRTEVTADRLVYSPTVTISIWLAMEDDCCRVSTLTRRRSKDSHAESWRVYGDVQVCTIGIRAGVPVDVDQ